jgi:hypothetical protein
LLILVAAAAAAAAAAVPPFTAAAAFAGGLLVLRGYSCLTIQSAIVTSFCSVTGNDVAVARNILRP